MNAIRDDATIVPEPVVLDPPRPKPLEAIVEYKGEALTLLEWGSRTGIPAYTIKKRLQDGWAVERALTEPNRKFREGKKTIRESTLLLWRRAWEMRQQGEKIIVIAAELKRSQNNVSAMIKKYALHLKKEREETNGADQVLHSDAAA